MVMAQEIVALSSSIALRFLTYFFLRWGLLPAVPPIAFALFAAYAPSFIIAYRSVPENVAGDSQGNATKKGHTHSPSQSHASARRPQPGILQTLLTGAPRPGSLLPSVITLLLNVICVVMVADRLFSERFHRAQDLSFVRVGYVSDTEARFLIREPDQSLMPVTIDICVREADDAPSCDDETHWTAAGRISSTSTDTDYTGPLFASLESSSSPKTHQWRSSNGHAGEFASALPLGHTDNAFTFISTSCVVSRLPYNPLDHPLAIPGMRHLAAVLPSLKAQFMLFLGDFIYIDIPRYWSTDVTEYRQKYRQVYASPNWPPIGQNLSWIHVLDDHEIANDWSANHTGVYSAALEPFNHYHAAVNPPASVAAGDNSPGATYFEFAQGPASFFLLDTRSYRSSNALPATDPDKTMLGPAQLAALLAFLARDEAPGVRWKMVASSVPFTKNWHVNNVDTWGGFLVERRRVLEAMWEVARRGYGLVVLSGDRHEFAATKFPPPPGHEKWAEGERDMVAVWEFSASPLSQFYSPVPVYFQRDEEDVKIKYIHKGNSKFGVITIESWDQGRSSRLLYRLFVDGVEVWSTTLNAPRPVESH